MKTYFSVITFDSVQIRRGALYRCLMLLYCYATHTNHWKFEGDPSNSVAMTNITTFSELRSLDVTWWSNLEPPRSKFFTICTAQWMLWLSWVKSNKRKKNIFRNNGYFCFCPLEAKLLALGQICITLTTEKVFKELSNELMTLSLFWFPSYALGCRKMLK